MSGLWGCETEIDDFHAFQEDMRDARGEDAHVQTLAFRRSVRQAPAAPTCPHCQHATALVGGAVVYPHRSDLASKKFWLCHPCDAYVGCHPGTERPLGTPAGKALRGMRSRVHAALDPLWRSGRMTRNEVYRRLAEGSNIPKDECHVGMYDVDRCVLALETLQKMAG